MKKFILITALLIAATLVLAGCGPADYSHTFKTLNKLDNYVDGNYSHYLVCYEPAQNDFRVGLEDDVAAQLRARGIAAKAFHQYFDVQKTPLSQVQLEQLLTAGDYDAILIFGEQDNYSGKNGYNQLFNIANPSNTPPKPGLQTVYAKVYSAQSGDLTWKTAATLIHPLDTAHFTPLTTTAIANDLVNWLNNDDLLNSKYNLPPQQAVKMLALPNLTIDSSKAIKPGAPNTFELKAPNFDGKYLVQGFSPVGSGNNVVLGYSAKLAGGKFNIVVTDSQNQPLYVLGSGMTGNAFISSSKYKDFKIYFVGQQVKDLDVKLTMRKEASLK
ncbi:MAG: hypothetical protein WCP79_04590 [Bacillota bacterium]